MLNANQKNYTQGRAEYHNEQSGIYRSIAPGETAKITANAATINAMAIAAVKATLPRLAGNLPRTIQYWLSK